MFFSPELLERRDSGYGLLWLAATLGAKSSFKKLPKRSVLTADISQLCGLIAEPAEPLALRLSSNLMIGVARVYKVKEEIFFADVTTCFNALKKAVQEFSSMSANAAQLQMGQPSMRVETLTLAADPAAAFSVAFDGIFVAWDERLQEDDNDQGSDAEFDPNARKPRSKSKGKQREQEPPLSATAEHARGLHTLDEHHTDLLAAAFARSLTGSVQAGAGFAASSSQVGGFDFDDNLFALPDGAGGADIGDELAQELGEGWGGSAFQPTQDQAAGNLGDLNMDIDMGLGDDFHFNAQQDPELQPDGAAAHNDPTRPGSLPPSASVIVPLAPFSPRGSDTHSDPAVPVDGQPGNPAQRKPKRVRLLLDARTELTDDELKMARANYVQEQEALKREVAEKRARSENTKLIEEMIYGAPRGVQAPVLVDFWMEHFKLHVEARSGQLQIQMEGEPPKKRRRVNDPEIEGIPAARGDGFPPTGLNDFGMDVDQPLDFGGGYGDYTGMGNEADFDSRMRSSEEPGQARRGSRPPSAMGSHLDIDLRGTQDVISGSQRSAFFPWDHAGPSSSVVGGGFGLENGSDVFSGMRRASKRSRGSSYGSRRESSLLVGTVPPSPVSFAFRNSQIEGDDFQFNVPDEANLEESQQSNVLTLERNSHNFLEYAKMQLRAFPNPASELAFDDVVPKATSTPRVAAAAFYHCLVLSTKNMLGVRQEEPYGVLNIRVK